MVSFRYLSEKVRHGPQDSEEITYLFPLAVYVRKYSGHLTFDSDAHDLTSRINKVRIMLAALSYSQVATLTK